MNIFLIDSAINSSGSHYDVAKIVKDIYKEEYNKNKIAIFLSEKISKVFLERAMYYNDLVMITSDEGQKELYNKKAITAANISLKLKNSSYKNNIMREYKYICNS